MFSKLNLAVAVAGTVTGVFGIGYAFATAVPKQLNTIAKNNTLKEFYALCAASVSIFFGGLVIVLLRAKPMEEETAVIIESAKGAEQTQEKEDEKE